MTMKYLFLLSITIVLLACKKDITKEKNHFLRGRVLTDCNGSPIANQEVQLWRNTFDGNLLQQSVPGYILDKTTTNDEGYFYFEGKDDYLQSKNPSLDDASVRLPNGLLLATGILGENSQAKNKYNTAVNKNVGDIYANGMTSNVNLKISAVNGTVTYDSVIVSYTNFTTNEYNQYNEYTEYHKPSSDTLRTVNNNYFTTSLNNIKLTAKHFHSPDIDDHLKYYFGISMKFYINGSSTGKDDYTYFNECSANNTYTFEF